MNGHKFVQRQFYQVILCAFCSEFLLNATGYQCEDCRYTCHKKCYEKVVTKCISKSTGVSRVTGYYSSRLTGCSQEDDEDKINHRIPHRFETITNIGANWCCHCGYMLPLGRKNARRCTECDITCHANCAHLVPDFCGMSMETANQLLAEIQKVKATRTAAAGRQRPARAPTASMEQIGGPQVPPYPGMGPGPDSGTPMDGLRSSMDHMQIRPVESAPSGDYGRPPLPMHQQDSAYRRADPSAPAARIPPGARIPEPPMPFVDQQQARFKPPEPDGIPPGAGYTQVCSRRLFSMRLLILI